MLCVQFESDRYRAFEKGDPMARLSRLGDDPKILFEMPRDDGFSPDRVALQRPQ